MIKVVQGQIRAAMAATGGVMLASGTDWRLHLAGAIVVFSGALWSFVVHMAPLPKETQAMKLSDFLGAVSAILDHPSTFVPPEVQPQAQAIRDTIATAGANIEAQAASAVIPTAEHSISTVLNHNHLGQYAPLAVTFFDVFAHAWVANKGSANGSQS